MDETPRLARFIHAMADFPHAALRTALCAALILAAPAPARSQLGPPGGLAAPLLPRVTGVLAGALDPVTGLPLLAEAPRLAGVADLRRLQVDRLLRRNRRVLEPDPQGEPVVRGRVLAVSPTRAALAAAAAAGFAVAGEVLLEDLQLRVVTLEAPPGLSTRAALDRLRRLDPGGAYDFDHVFLGGGVVTPGAGPAGPKGGEAGPAPRGAAAGLVDTGVAVGHPALRGLHVEQRGFAPGGVKAAAHGTAVASLLAGTAAEGPPPPRSLLAADVYGSGPTGGSVDGIVAALGWMAKERVAVVNVSLVGPANAVLGAVVAAMLRRGQLIVAPVGNDGPAAPPLYPASYPGVIAVTAVDPRRRLLVEAGRAGHVDFAAPGAGLLAAQAGGGYGGVRGTSFAAPLVARALAAQLAAQPASAPPAAAVSALAREALDLGRPGPDPLYGRGLVGAGFRLRTGS